MHRTVLQRSASILPLECRIKHPSYTKVHCLKSNLPCCTHRDNRFYGYFVHIETLGIGLQVGIGPAPKVAVLVEENAEKPAKTTSARIEERSNAFMGKVLLFSLIVWW